MEMQRIGISEFCLSPVEVDALGQRIFVFDITDAEGRIVLRLSFDTAETAEITRQAIANSRGALSGEFLETMSLYFGSMSEQTGVYDATN